MEMILRYYQEEAVQSVFDYFDNGKRGNPLIACPTGTGKALILAGLLHRIMAMYPSQRLLVLSHVKEILVQDAEKLVRLSPTASYGMYSAGLKTKDAHHPITFGGIASVNSHPEEFGHRDLIFVDEAHLISQNESSMYLKVINKLKEINPYLKVIGLTATPYRIGQGLVTDGGIFTDICYNLCTMESFNRLVSEGYICPLIPKRTSMQFDLSSVGISRGDYKDKELQDAVDNDELTFSAVKELVEYSHDRHCGLVFTTGIDHCEHVTSTLQSMGESATCVHSKMPTGERDKRIIDFKAGVYKWMVNNGCLTTGFDHPPIDIGGILRPTCSVSLWVQILGRFTRPYSWLEPNQYVKGFDYIKSECLILDFCGNTPRLGPINDPVIPRKRGQATGDAPIRICPLCGVYNHASARFCCGCLAPFEFKSKLESCAGTAELIKQEQPIIETYNVTKVICGAHQKQGSQKVMQVSYYCGLRCFKEWVAIEHSGFARKRAEEWWMQRSPEPCPMTVVEALTMQSKLRAPRKINVNIAKRYPEVVNCEY